jgi:FlaA1/EpsC-like NDP-sugar epimerase
VLLTALRIMFHFYQNIWRFPSTQLYIEMIIVDVSAYVLAIAAALIARCFSEVGLVPSALLCCSVTLVTMLSRLVYRYLYASKTNRRHEGKIHVAIVGAGNVGVLLAKELQCNPDSDYTPYCFIDSDPEKVNSYIAGLRVYPEDDQILETLKTMPVQEIILAMPTMPAEKLQDIYLFYLKTGFKVKLYDFPVKENASINQNGRREIRSFKIEDLLFRDTIHLDQQPILDFCCGKTVLITGGGGSIGSELCRQVAKCQPKKLIVLDIYENNAYDIQQELRNVYHDDLDLEVEIASVRNYPRLFTIFRHYQPDIVFHAAAHKHVPLMEHSAYEAIKNNVFGTYNAANAAEAVGVKKFILISTDKAVNPTNVMGASKRLCEMVIQCRTDSKTSFAAVRFGNVLGSNGSVIPLFRRQIQNGGPVTITDKRIIRYFMTIPEAAQLVLCAGALAKSGELFVLDMGKPVKIMELAENMIRLSGYTPYKDIEIKEIGLRPGEKLYEELLMANESLTVTENSHIFVENDAPLSREEMEAVLDRLRDAIAQSEDSLDSTLIRETMMQLVPTYHDAESVNAAAHDSKEMQMVDGAKEAVTV